MDRKLFLCNTVYQIMISAWLKYKVFSDIEADIIISNHINGYKTIANNIKKVKLFNEVYTVDSKEKSQDRIVYKNKLQLLYHDCCSNAELKRYIDIKCCYDELFVSNLDGFTKLLFSVLNRKYKTKIHMFEDGISTYSKLYEQFYENTKKGNSFHDFLKYVLFRNKTVYGNVISLWVLNPDTLLWNPKYEVNRIPVIETDSKFKKMLNVVFDYDNMTDNYDKKYIYFEESFFADTGYMEDVELVNKLADIVGKDNVMVKIHPRNQKNRFKELGYKTNEDISIPWEVILMNNDFSDKILITIGSQTIVTPCILFDMHIKSFSLYNCVNEKPKVLSGSLFDVLLTLYDKYSEDITLCNSIEDIQ